MAILGKQQRGQAKVPIIVLAAVLLLLFPLNSLLGEYDEYQMKAILMGEIAKLVEWPKGNGMSDLNTPFIIGIFGDTPLSSQMESYYTRGGLKPRKLKDKLVEIRYIKRIEDIPECHMLFIADMPKRIVTRIVETLQDKPVLTVTDSMDSLVEGFHVGLVVGDASSAARRKKIPTIKIVVNETALRQAGFIPSKQLLEIGEVIHPFNPYEEKANKLEPIAQFITWPENSTVDDRRKPFVISVIGQNLFDKYLDDIYKKKKIKDKKVNIRYISRIDEISDSNLLFISQSLKDRVSEIVAFTKNKPILMVGDTRGFIQRGVHINFFIDRFNLYFEVNQEAALASGFQISYHLLKMARTDVSL